MSPEWDIDTLRVILQNGTIELEGQFMLGSNYTFLATIRHEEQEVMAVYKPSRGERPLWDFPEHTLAQREVAAYLVSEAIGWGFVPLTVLREDGPLGTGSLQQFIEYDPDYHYFTFSEAEKQRLHAVVMFDLLINNADRKGSHVLIEKGTDRLYLIDHGLCFHSADKLRTVIWDFAGQTVSADLQGAVERLSDLLANAHGLRETLEPYLSPDEVEALAARAQRLQNLKAFPSPPEERRAYPWPPV